MSAGRDPVFRRCVQAHLAAWSSLQLAVREGMPGSLAGRFGSWLLDAVESFFYENADLYADEVSGFVADIVNTELDALIEDGSLEVVAAALCAAFRLCRSGRHDVALQELERLPTPSAELLNFRPAAEDTLQDDEEKEGSAGRQDPAASATGQSSSADMDIDMAVDDGWTTAVRRKR